MLKLSDEAIRFKDLSLKLNNNNYELLFSDLPNVFGTDYINVYTKTKTLLDEYKTKIDSLYDLVLKKTKEMFDIFDASLKTGIDSWMNKNSQISNIVFENNHKSIYNAMKTLTFNEKTAINSLSFGCVNCGIDDFNQKKYDDYFKNLKSFIDKVINYNVSENTSKGEFKEYDMENIKLSSLANTLYTNILESVEEYGDSVSNEEKALVYKKLLNDLLK